MLTAPECPDAPRWAGRPGSGAPRVLVVSGSVGAGHDGAANELASRLRAAGVEVDVRDLLAVLPAPIPRVLRDGYTVTVDRVPGVFERLFGALEGRGIVRGAMLGVCRLGEAGVARWLRAGRYDAVVSTYPLASQILGELRRKGTAPMPLVTYLTDPAAHNSWVHPLVDLHLTVTSATATRGAAAYGVAMTEAGPLVPHRFSEPVSPRQLLALRTELGLPADRRVALLVAGSLGIGDVVPTIEHVAAAGLTPLVLCGRNERLRLRAAAVTGAVALGWRDDVHELMALSDVLVHNAGGLSFTEALVAGLPAISYRCIPGHGQANAAVLDEAGIAPWAHSPDELRAALVRQTAVRPAPPLLLDPADRVLALLPARRPLAASA